MSRQVSSATQRRDDDAAGSGVADEEGGSAALRAVRRRVRYRGRGVVHAARGARRVCRRAAAARRRGPWSHRGAACHHGAHVDAPRRGRGRRHIADVDGAAAARNHRRSRRPPEPRRQERQRHQHRRRLFWRWQLGASDHRPGRAGALHVRAGHVGGAPRGARAAPPAAAGAHVRRRDTPPQGHGSMAPHRFSSVFFRSEVSKKMAGVDKPRVVTHAASAA